MALPRDKERAAETKPLLDHGGCLLHSGNDRLQGLSRDSGKGGAKWPHERLAIRLALRDEDHHT
ncbi:MAG: hypothetical protein CMM60_09705 [Rhodospirillaceae bacterium]|nr:hypothetical protein [Rhodospirillaceae bacterium]